MRYKLAKNGVIDKESGSLIPNSPKNRHWQEYQRWLALGNVADPEHDDQELVELDRASRVAAVNLAMEAVINSPSTIILRDKTYFMDCKYDSALRFKAGIDLANLLGESTMEMVDYYNMVHTVTVEDALAICLEQARAYRDAYITRAQGRAAILSEE